MFLDLGAGSQSAGGSSPFGTIRTAIPQPSHLVRTPMREHVKKIELLIMSFRRDHLIIRCVSIAPKRVGDLSKRESH